MTTGSVVLGFDFGGTKTSVALADSAGARLATRTIATRADLGAHRCVANAVDVAGELLSGAAASRLAAAAAATFGVPQDGRVVLAPAVPGWEDIDLRGLLEAALGTHVIIANDVKAAATAEIAHGSLTGSDPAIYVNLGTGIAVAVVIGGGIVGGAHGASGEIAYNLDADDETGRPLGGSAPLERRIGGRALDPDGTGPGPADIDRLGRIFGRHLVNLCNAVDPQRVAIGGGLVQAWDILGPILRDALDAAVPFPPELVRASYPYDAALIGALALALHSTNGAAVTRPTARDETASHLSGPAPVRSELSSLGLSGPVAAGPAGPER